MKAVILLAVFVVAVAAESELRFPCPKKNRPSDKTDCSYYCKKAGKWELGKYQNDIPCDYNSQGDGVCKEGLVVTTTNRVQPTLEAQEALRTQDMSTKKTKRKRKSGTESRCVINLAFGE
uniref:Basic tail salivary tick protein n=1 Tax=Ornithodoros parkeri TaxID=140564 RepID=A6N9U6_ORNPR|nr:basic tail salivary tick protein [Ornithodoros parkeri]